MEKRSEFKNVSGGHVGAQVKDHDGRMRGVDVAPDATIWLDESEQIATANAPRKDEDNPFTNGTFELLTPATEVANRRPIGHTEKPQVTEVGSAAAEGSPGGPQAEGDGASNGGDEGSPPGGPDEPQEPVEEQMKQEPAPAAEEAGETGQRAARAQEEEENAKEAARRAVKAGKRPQHPEETGAAAKPAGKAPVGKRMASEQVGTPEAAKK